MGLIPGGDDDYVEVGRNQLRKPREDRDKLIKLNIELRKKVDELEVDKKFARKFYRFP